MSMPFSQIDKERLDVLAGVRGSQDDYAVRRRDIQQVISNLGAAATSLATARRGIDAASADLASLSERVNGTGGLADRLDTAEGDLETAQDDIEAVETRLTNAEARLDAAETGISDLQTRMSAVENEINRATTGILARLDTLESYHATP